MGRDRRLLVTGAGGQLGSALGRLVPEAVLLDRPSLDVTDREAVLEAIMAHRPAVVVHAAAYTRVDAAESEAEEARRINACGSRAVAEAAQEVGALLVYPSTDYVFRGDKDGPYTEEDDTAPLSVYGSTKLEGERVAAACSRHLVVRTSWVYGRGHNFVRTIIEAARSREEVAVVDDQRGRPTYAEDLAEAILGLVERGAAGLYHLAGGGDPATWADLAEAAIGLAGLTTRVRRVTTAEYYAGRPGPTAPRPANSVLDCSRAASEGVALRPWRQALADYVREVA